MKLKRSRKGMSEALVTMLLLGITAVGGVFVWGVFSGESGIQDVGSIDDSSITSLDAFILTGYDTRDGSDLSGIGGLDNSFDGQLSKCEFLVLKLRNEYFDYAEISSIKVNEVTHKWAGFSSGSILGGGGDDDDDGDDDDEGGGGGSGNNCVEISGGGSSFLKAGNFAVISDSSSSLVSREVPENSDVRLVIALSDDFSAPDSINTNEEIDIIISASGGSKNPQYVIPSGATR